jgi:hypothetical protein
LGETTSPGKFDAQRWMNSLNFSPVRFSGSFAEEVTDE